MAHCFRDNLKLYNIVFNIFENMALNYFTYISFNIVQYKVSNIVWKMSTLPFKYKVFILKYVPFIKAFPPYEFSSLSSPWLQRTIHHSSSNSSKLWPAIKIFLTFPANIFFLQTTNNIEFTPVCSKSLL